MRSKGLVTLPSLARATAESLHFGKYPLHKPRLSSYQAADLAWRFNRSLGHFRAPIVCALQGLRFAKDKERTMDRDEIVLIYDVFLKSLSTDALRIAVRGFHDRTEA